MRHLNEEELIELYYGEAPSAASAHLAACPECAAEYQELRQTLYLIWPADPQLPAKYGEQVWQTLQPRLIPYPKRTMLWHEWTWLRAVTLAVNATMLLAVAFLGGRYWERHVAHSDNVAVNGALEVTQRKMLVALMDHLDRTERLLVALEHADSSDHVENAQLRSEARELLASNRLYRTTATDAGDSMLASMLEQVNSLLAEVANDPTLTAADLQRVRQEMNTQGLLFEIRVLMAQRPDRGNHQSHARGRSI